MRINILSPFAPKKYNHFQKVQNVIAPKTAPLSHDVFIKNVQNVSFKGADVSCAQAQKLSIPNELEKFSTQFETEIISQMKPQGKTKNPLNPEFIKNIENKFREDDITGVINPGIISLNNVIIYLIGKEHIKLPHYGDGKVACFIDNYSLEWLKKYNYTLDLKNTIFYTAENNADSTKAELEEIFNTGKDIQVSTIKHGQNNKDFSCPDAKTVANTIETYVEYKFPDDMDMQNEFRKALCNYLDDCTVAFSYQTLAKKCKQQYKLIEKEVKKLGKTMDDVSFIVPFQYKSYDLINYMFAVENNIKPRKFIDKTQAADEISAFSCGHRIYAVLDDFCASGASFIKSIPETREPFYMIFSPIVGTQTGREKIEKEQEEKQYAKFKYIPVVNYNEMGYVDKLKHNRNDENRNQKIDKYCANFQKLSKKDIDLLTNYMLGGHGDIFSSVFFPYMLPDNSSEIATLLARNFLDNDSRCANKGVAGNKFCQISKEDYKKLMEIIEGN